ncbi:hypothetical protein IFM46972_10298 [Aspergillus udagawae]|uniref:Uncharacterized protein n=1 Tax=Aspergillus udagawae TaxID=91492 RepID=A0A8H3XNV2_9EURO|nr:hypothetical protein IFM46972_10298 [Aspergillus udagawae]
MSVTPHYIKRGGLSGGVLSAAAAPMGKTVVISPGEYLNSIANWVITFQKGIAERQAHDVLSGADLVIRPACVSEAQERARPGSIANRSMRLDFRCQS